MSETDAFVATVRAVDRASAPLKKIGAQLRGLVGIQNQVKEASKGLAESGSRHFDALAQHVKLVSGHVGTLDSKIKKVTGSLTAFLPMLGGMAGVGSLAGIFMLTDKAATGSAKSAADAAKVGISKGQLGGLKYAARMSEVDPDALVPSFERLNKAIAAASAGKNKDVAALFSRLGISLKGADGHIRTVAEVMPQLSDAIKNADGPAERTRIAMALFGKAGADLLPMLMKGSEALKAYAEDGKRLGYEATEVERAALQPFHEQMIRLNAVTGSFSRAVGVKLAPILEPVLHKVTDLIIANKDWMASFAAEKVKAIADALKQIDWNDLIERVKGVVSVFTSFGSSTMGLVSIMGGMALVITSPLIGAIAGLIGILKDLGIILRGLTFLGLGKPDFRRGRRPDRRGRCPRCGSGGSRSKATSPICNGIVASFQSAWQYIEPIVQKIAGAVGAIRNSWAGRHLGLGTDDTSSGPGPRAPAPVSPYQPRQPGPPQYRARRRRRAADRRPGERAG